MIVGCPTCGAAVEFRFDDSFVRVCGSCRAAVLRTDRGIETLGKLADLVPIESPLRLFADGRFGSSSFLLVGMAQLRHAAGGIWQEWYAKLDGGAWAWVSEAQGRYYLTFEKPGVAVPPFDHLAPGAQLVIDGRPFTVGELGTASYASASGEIPYRLDPAATFQFADLLDGQGGFATIDYGDGDEPTVYLGIQVSLPDLGISGGEVATSTGTRAQGRTLPCPNCGGSLELRAPDQTLRVGCPYCNHLVSVQSGNLAVIASLAKAKPAIALGTKGRFVDGELTVIGYLQRSALADGIWYPFEEYLLYAPEVGFRWLQCSDGHWSYVQPVAPGAVDLAPVRYDGITFELFARVDVRVDVVLGELYWQVAAGERVRAEDFIAPPAMLSCETSDTEQSWSLSTYLRARDVRTAFAGLEVPLPTPIGIGANQPYPLHGIGKVATVITAALLLAGVGRCTTAENALKHSQRVDVPPKSASAPVAPEALPHIVFSEPFHLDGGKNIEVQLDAGLINNWVYVVVDVVNDQTGGVVSFDKNLEYYKGISDGEAWTEGSRRDSQVLAPLPAGDYVLRVEAQQGGTFVLDLNVTVRQDVFRARWFWAAVIALGVLFGLIAFHAFSFRKRRWANSNPVRWTENTSSDDHGGDDE